MIYYLLSPLSSLVLLLLQSNGLAHLLFRLVVFGVFGKALFVTVLLLEVTINVTRLLFHRLVVVEVLQIRRDLGRRTLARHGW